MMQGPARDKDPPGTEEAHSSFWSHSTDPAFTRPVTSRNRDKGYGPCRPGVDKDQNDFLAPAPTNTNTWSR